METKFQMGNLAFTVSTQPIADPRPGFDSSCGGLNHVSVQIAQSPLGDGGAWTVHNLMLKPSEARTIASALMTAAQSVR